MFVRRVACFILRDEEGRVLLQHRDKNAPILLNHWAFFGGGIEEGESPEEAVKREAKEELDIELKELKFFKKYEFREEQGLYEKFFFIAKLNHSIEELKTQQKEGQNLSLFSFNDLKKLQISDNDMIVLKDLFNQQ